MENTIQDGYQPDEHVLDLLSLQLAFQALKVLIVGV